MLGYPSWEAKCYVQSHILIGPHHILEPDPRNLTCSPDCFSPGCMDRLSPRLRLYLVSCFYFTFPFFVLPFYHHLFYFPPSSLSIFAHPTAPNPSSYLPTLLQFVQESPFLTRDLLESCFPYALLRDAYNSVYRKPQVCVCVCVCCMHVCVCVCVCAHVCMFVCVSMWRGVFLLWKPQGMRWPSFHSADHKCTCYIVEPNTIAHCHHLILPCSISHVNIIVMVRLHFSGIRPTYSLL